MKLYEVSIVPEALEQLYERLLYLLLVKRSEQAYDAVLEDYYDTRDELAKVAGSIQDPPEQELRDRGLKRLPFLRHKYVMLYTIDGDEAVITNIFHDSEDYIRKLP